MKIATVLFTYNRSIHTGKVLEALSKNEVLPQKLYIFQDGVKESTNLEEWEKVTQIIKAVDWCDVELVIHEKNKGLADSIVYGLNYVFQENDAVIVLEDDCVTHPQFMTFMNSALIKYEHEKKVFSVSGYAWPVEVKENGTDAYFTRRICSTGWGTWKDCWMEYERDYRILGKIKKDTNLNQSLYIWGQDLESHLLGNIYGRCDSWAVFWALKVIEKEGYCVSPYNSYIKNIGYDGSGIHSGKVPIPEASSAEEKRKIELPDVVELSIESLENFRDYFRWRSREEKLQYYNNVLIKWCLAKQRNRDINKYFQEKNIHRIAIWGTGNICDLLLNELSEDIEVVQMIESKPNKKEYRGILVTGYEQLDNKVEFVVVIPGYDIQEIQKKISEMYSCQIASVEEIIERL